MKNYYKTAWTTNGIVAIICAFFISCAIISPDIPWEERWASSYCVTTDWDALEIDPASPSVLCNLSQKYQVTLNEAQGVIFLTTLLASLPDPEKTVPIIGEYVTNMKQFLVDNPAISLADLLLKVTVDTDNPRYHILKQLLNIGIISTWGQDPMAKWILYKKDYYFLNAHFDNILYQIGYSAPLKI